MTTVLELQPKIVIHKLMICPSNGIANDSTTKIKKRRRTLGKWKNKSKTNRRYLKDFIPKIRGWGK